MSEYKTLNEWFPNGRGDGRKFVANNDDSHRWYEPIILAISDIDRTMRWHVITTSGLLTSFDDQEEATFKEYEEPKKTVKMYQPILKSNQFDNGYFCSNIFNSKEECRNNTSNIYGYIIHEVELE